MELIAQMLDLSRLEAGQMPLELAEHPLERLFAEALEAMPPLSGGQRARVGPGTPIAVRCDASVVARVLANLLGNAARCIGESGSIELSARAEGAFARVAVADDGPGIPPEHRSRIFEKFVQGPQGPSRGGAGLGLTFCRLAVEAHGGSIGVEEPEGGGSLFWFTLPLAPSGEGGA